MMLVGSPVSSKGSPSTSPLPLHSSLAQSDTDTSEETKHSPDSQPPPCWATQALRDLAGCETELRHLRERQIAETGLVRRGVERALLGAHREERRLLERVEQDHRDTQRRLEQVQRENEAAAKIGQSLVEQRLQKVALLRDQIQKRGDDRTGDAVEGEEDLRQDQLLKSVAEMLQPWEISLALKRVSFKPSAQPKAITFGEINVQDHTISLPVGGCGPLGQLCSIHANEVYCGGPDGEGRSTPDAAGPGQGQVVMMSKSGRGLRVVRKISLSGRCDEESGEEVKPLSPKSHSWPLKQDLCEHDSSQEEELESSTSEMKGDEVFLAVPAFLSNGESDGEDTGYRRNGAVRPLTSRGERKQREFSPSPERSCQEHRSWHSQRTDRQDKETDTVRVKQTSPRVTPRFGHWNLPSSRSPRETLSSQNFPDTSSRGHPRSRLSVCSDDHTHGRTPSPTDSVDSGYTFIVSSPRDYTTNLTSDTRRSKSTADLSQQKPPHIIGIKGEQSGLWRVNRSRLTALSRSPSQKNNKVSRTVSYPSPANPCPKHSQQHTSVRRLCGVSRSLSMSVIDGSSHDRFDIKQCARQQQPRDRGILRGERSEPALLEHEENVGLSEPSEVRLVRQFGKQGSGRADFTLPSGIHATLQGQLFLVDCGNARIQVTDPCGNVLQQVISPGNDPGGSSHRCRNYFDVAVNAKGLIALSCAAERALLVFSRHGRLLQTFGGGSYVSGVPRDELEAPRGVTVTQSDEFLVADIRKGTLTAMKLEPKTGSRLERTVVTDFCRPYLVAACQTSGLVAVSERGNETGREPCVKVLGPGWDTLRILGVCSGLGPVLSSPWGLCIDQDGAVLVADWAQYHCVVLYPAEGRGRAIITQGLSSPRGLALLPDGLLVVSDSMHHCMKIYRYK